MLMDYSEWPATEALSKIDEKNLKQIAKDMNVTYLNRNQGGSLDSVLSDLKKDIQVNVTQEAQEEGTVQIESEENLWYWLVLAIVLMLTTEAVLLIRRR